MRSLLIALVSLVAGLALGWALHGALATTESASVSRSAVAGGAADAAHAEDPALSRGDRTEEPSASAGDRAKSSSEHVRTEEAGLISAALRRYAQDELRAGWAEVRRDPMPEATVDAGFAQFEEQLKRMPRAIGRELGGRQTSVDTLAGDDVLAIVQALHEGDLDPQPELVRDRERFARFFECAAGPSLEGTRVDSSNAARWPDGTRLVFPAGVYSLQRVSALLAGMQPGPRCITISGAGMDQTLFVDARLSVRDGMQRFTLRDCTFEGLDVLDARSATNAILIERVRFAGFDVAAGSSNPFRASSGVALYVRDSRIEGGYGRKPDSGNLFDMRTNGLLARFERCQLSGLQLPLDWLHNGATLHFSQCQLVDMLDRAPLADDPSGRITFDGCRIEMRERDAPPGAQRDLNELFPEWKKRVVR